MRFRNVNDMYDTLLPFVMRLGSKVETRNGMAMAMDRPLLLAIERPQERVLFNEARDCNPFFHLFEALWMVQGGRDVAFPTRFNKRMAEYSDDGLVFNAPYGHRWRAYFGYDQLERACKMLRHTPEDRRVVIGMWDPVEDLGSSSKDVPCNTQIMLRIVEGRLQMTTTNRSNDLIWGLCGANAVHLSILHEYLAARIGVPMGTWFHMTNNLHVYEQHWPLVDKLEVSVYGTTLPVVENWRAFEGDCTRLVGGGPPFRTAFFIHTVGPMLRAWEDRECAFSHAREIAAPDWKRATIEWLSRRQK